MSDDGAGRAKRARKPPESFKAGPASGRTRDPATDVAAPGAKRQAKAKASTAKEQPAAAAARASTASAGGKGGGEKQPRAVAAAEKGRESSPSPVAAPPAKKKKKARAEPSGGGASSAAAAAAALGAAAAGGGAAAAGPADGQPKPKKHKTVTREEKYARRPDWDMDAVIENPSFAEVRRGNGVFSIVFWHERLRGLTWERSVYTL